MHGAHTHIDTTTRISFEPNERSTCHRCTNLRLRRCSHPIRHQYCFRNTSSEIDASISGLTSCFWNRIQGPLRIDWSNTCRCHYGHRPELLYPQSKHSSYRPQLPAIRRNISCNRRDTAFTDYDAHTAHSLLTT